MPRKQSGRRKQQRVNQAQRGEGMAAALFVWQQAPPYAAVAARRSHDKERSDTRKPEIHEKPTMIR